MIEQNIDKCIEGDSRALANFYKEIAKPVLSVAFNILGDKSLAEDVLHDVYLKSISKLSSWDRRSKVNTWVYQIAVNECLRLKRRWQSWRKIEARITEESSGDFSQQPSQANRQLARRFLDVLDPKTRAIIVLKHVEGLSFEEVSEVMNLPVGTLKSISSRALKKEARRLERFQK